MILEKTYGFEDSPYDKALRQAIPGASPIFYCDAEYVLTTGRKKATLTAKNVVLKGSVDEVNQNQKSKIALSLLRDESDHKKKAAVFDLGRIQVRKLTVIKLLGYGPTEKI